MLGVYRVNYTVIADDHTFSDYFFCRDKDEIKESIQSLCKDYNVVDTYLGDGCISCVSNEYDLAITVESTVIFTDEQLASLITS